MPEPPPQLSVLSAPSFKLPKAEINKEDFVELDSISLREILDEDSRPTLVLDLDYDYVDYHDTKHGIWPIFCNAALRLHYCLLDDITGVDAKDTATWTEEKQAYSAFRSWATGVTEFDDSRDVFPLTYMYKGMLWTGSTIRRRWRVISGNQCYDVSHLPKEGLRDASKGPSSRFAPSCNLVPKRTTPRSNSWSPSPPQPAIPTVDVHPVLQSSTLVSHAPPQVSGERSVKTSGGTSSGTTASSSVTLSSPKNRGCPDWTIEKPRGQLSEHMIFARGVDWAATPLGSMASWSIQFREIANLVMKNPHPASLFWGEELTMLYNEAYKNEVAGNKHPEMMGTGFSGPFSEVWDRVASVLRECVRTGQSFRKECECVSIERYGYLEETHFSWSIVPVYGGSSQIRGFYCAPFETTYQTINSRRLQTVKQLGEKLSEARSIKSFWRSVLDGIEDNHWDVPFALLYSIIDSDDADTASHSSDSTISLKSCLLEGSIGIPDEHPCQPARLDLKRSIEGFVPAFRDAMRTREPTILHTRNGTLPEDLIEGIQWRGHGDPCKEAIIIPVRPTNGENIFAFLLLGVNPRRSYDESYRQFAHLINRELANSLASFLLFEDEIRRSRRVAETAVLQREELSQQLERQAGRMRRMAELSPLGMSLFHPSGALLEANERYYEMTGLPRDDFSSMGFLGFTADADSRQKVEKMWERMKTDTGPQQEELHIQNPNFVPHDPKGEPIEYWVLATCQPDICSDGVVSIMGSIADISQSKWAQGLQDRRLREAEETKRQQNEFIDMTSHEMRNPLSAILICADNIQDTLSQHKFQGDEVKLVYECMEAANNIALCVNHQKSIVDDILTVSKLDSNLLLITPVAVQPVSVVSKAMSMFKPEVHAKDIEFRYYPDASLEELDIHLVYLDPGRVLQITVNLITNAIKFTQTSPKRVISVRLSASSKPPKSQHKGFEYIPVRAELTNITIGKEWGQGQLLYIRVDVEDTGCGLTEEEKSALFERFAQASPRTHAHYGGSGLGLFISRHIAELHGGQMGVSSTFGMGSAFGFFIQARRAPSESQPALAMLSPVALKKDVHTECILGKPVPPAFITIKSSPTTLPRRQSINEIITGTVDGTLHILIVEDNLLNQRVLSKQLQKVGCIVHTANNGLIALDHLATTAFQQLGGISLTVILMDLEMPEMDGLTCVEKIRDMEREGKLIGHVPVIAVTANVREGQMKEAIDRGMDDVMSKPYRIPELLAKIKMVLERLGVDAQL